MWSLVRACAVREPLGLRRPNTARESPQLYTESLLLTKVASTQVAPLHLTSISEEFRSLCIR